MRESRTDVACALIVGVLTAMTPGPVSATDAGTLVTASERARGAGDLERALLLMQEAYAIDPAPALLNNVGALLEMLGRYREAYDTFRQVIERSDTPNALKERDTKRMKSLQPKVESAWLLVRRTPKQQVFVDGVPWSRNAEGHVASGEHTVHVHDPAGRFVWFERIYSVAGRRAEVRVDLRTTGRIDVVCPTTVQGVEVDRAPVPVVVAEGTQLHVAPGVHDIVLRCTDRPAFNWRGEITTRAVRITPPERLIAPAVVGSPVDQDTPRWGPWVVGIAGAVAAGGGAGLLVDAENRNNIILGFDANQDGISDLSFAEAASRKSTADTERGVGVTALSVGLVAITVAVVWYVIE